MPEKQVRPQAVVLWFLTRPVVILVVLVLLVVIGLLNLYSVGFYKYEIVNSATDDQKVYSDSGNLYHSIAHVTSNELKVWSLKHVDSESPLETALGRHRNFEGLCNVSPVDHKDPSISQYMVRLGELECTIPNRKCKVSLNGSSIVIEGKGIIAVQCQSISSGSDGSIVIGEPNEFLRMYSPILKHGESGAIMNLASRRCIKPDLDLKSKFPSLIDLVFDDDCSSQLSQFTFENDGVLRHVYTKKCIMPKSDSLNPPNDTPLVLGDSCRHKFQLFGSIGVLQHVQSQSCIHNLHGGARPEQKLCLWNSCEDLLRLQYEWYLPMPTVPDVSRVIPLPDSCKGLMKVEVKFVDGDSVNEYASYVNAVPIPKRNGTKTLPNIFFIALEEASAGHIKRKLPKSYAYMKEKLKMMEMPKFSAASHTTEANFLAYLRGDSVSDDSQWSILELAKRAGYASSLSIDKPALFASFPKGATHSSMPLFTDASKYSGLCRSTQTIFDISFRYLEAFIAAYPEHPKFLAMLLSHITSGNFNALGYMDVAFESLLIDLHRLSSTMIVFTSMRGSLSGKLGLVPLGLAEYARPFLGIYVSEDIRAEHQRMLRAPRFLVTPFNVYGSLAKTLDSKFVPGARTQPLDELTTERSCSDAGVSRRVCPCV